MHVYALVQVSVFCVCVRMRARKGVCVVGVCCVSRLLSVFACARVFQICNS
jgi:hypothetical protein